MGPLARTLALLAMIVATEAITEKPLDMAKDSFDDQYRDCDFEMTAMLPVLNNIELHQNPLLARVWAKAKTEWEKKSFPVSLLLSPDEAIALMAYTMDDLYEEFNEAVLKAGRSHQEYRDNFHFKALHFLLTQALARLRDIQGQKIHHVYQVVPSVLYEAKRGDTVRFGHFVSASLREGPGDVSGMKTVFSVETNHSVDIQEFSSNPSEKQVLIPPFETFKVKDINRDGNVAKIILESAGTHSKYNCEWLRGGSISRDTPILGAFLLATTTLALATGIL